MNFSQWATTVPKSITGDSLWKVKVYQLALFSSDIGWHDVLVLAQDKRTIALADQLYRALGSIGANIAEGYSYGTGPNRARLYEYSLGSTRESRHWYHLARKVLGETVAVHRMDLMASLARQLLTIIPEQRGRVLKEDATHYQIVNNKLTSDENVLVDIGPLLTDIPFMVDTMSSDKV
jgi:four helix bundle protein